MPSPSVERARTALRFLLFGLILLAPLPFGSVQPWAVLAIELYAAALGMLALVIVWHSPGALPQQARRLSVPAGVVAVVALLQLIPLPGWWTRWVSPPTALVRADLAEAAPAIGGGWAPATLDPPATLDALLRWLAYLTIGLAAALAFRHAHHLKQAAVVLATAGAFQAAYGAAEYLSGRQHIFGYAKKHFLNEATGTFINRSHYASFLAMTLPFALMLALEGLRRAGRLSTVRERLVRLGDAAGLTAASGAVAAALIWAGIILSYSRAGLAVGLIAAGLTLFAGRRYGRAVILLLLIPTVLLLWQQVRAPGERFFEEGGRVLAGEQRLPAWRATLDGATDHLPLGSGLGTFEDVFPRYQPQQVLFRWEHAHNDWLQSLLEGGPLVLLALAIGLWLILRSSRPGEPTPTRARLLAGIPSFAAIVVAALHALVDFPLRIPAVAVLLACCVGLSCAARDCVEDDRVDGPDRRFHPRVIRGDVGV